MKILFVCLGNICRSPLAQGIFAHQAEARGLASRYDAASCGTGGWHVGEPPDPRALAAARRRGIELCSVCRQVHPSDFRDYDLILAMDASNRRDLLSLCPPEARGKVKLMRDFDPQGPGEDVPDPYYGGPEGFDTVCAILHRSCGRLLDHLEGSDGAAAA